MEDRKLLKSKRFLKTKICFVLAAVVFILLLSISFFSEQQWVLYRGKEIRGAVVRDETERPIEGAIVIGLWALVQVPGEGFGGYAKISVVQTDKEGKFTIPSWITFKPWKLCSLTHGLAPKIIIYNPGYRLYWSHKVGREGYRDDMSKTSDEKKRIKEANSINPAKLERIFADEEIWKAFEEFESERAPYEFFSRKQLKKMFNEIKKGTEQLPDTNNKAKEKIIKDVDEYSKYWVEGKR